MGEKINKGEKMAEVGMIYRCEVCGQVIEVIHSGVGTLVCCDQNMEEMVPKTEDEEKEKHVPVVEKTSGGVKVKIGVAPHPMEEEHYIEWIQVIVDGRSCRKSLKPGDAPEAEFQLSGEKMEVFELCNIHGVWKTEV